MSVVSNLSSETECLGWREGRENVGGANGALFPLGLVCSDFSALHAKCKKKCLSLMFSCVE